MLAPKTKLYTIDEVSEITGFPPSRILAWMTADDFNLKNRPFNYGKRWTQDDLEKLLRFIERYQDKEWFRG